MGEQVRRVAGLLLFLVIAAPLLAASLRTVGARLPQAPRLVRSIGGLALAVAALQLIVTALGLVSLLRLWALAPVIFVVGVVWLARAPSLVAASPSPGTGGGPLRTAALAAIAVVGTQWAWWTALALRQGVQRSDSLTYHLPTALAFAHTHSVRTPVATTIGSPASYYSDGMEVLHAMGIVLTRSDVLTCVSGFFFASLIVGACWSIGAKYDRGWLASLLACVVLAAPAVVQTQAGSALVDVPSAALVLTALAVTLWTSVDTSRALLPIALIAGAALAAKLLVLPVVVAVLAVAVWRSHTASSDGSLVTPAAWSLLALLETVPWLVRNAVKTGTPLPMVNIPGLRHLHFDQVNQLGRSAGTYLWQSVRYPSVGGGIVDGLRSGLGLGWGLLILATVGALVWSVRSVRTLGPVLLFGAAAFIEYLASPFGAGGPGEPPFLFAVNLRYAALAMLGAGLLLACRTRTAVAARWTGIVGIVALAVTALPSSVFASKLKTYRLDTWPAQHRSLGITLALVLAAVVALSASGAGTSFVASARRLAPSPRVTAGVLAVLGLVVLGVARSDVTSRVPAGADLDAVYRFADGLNNQRIGVVGLERTYPLAGRNLSNQVDAIVSLDGHGVPSTPASCDELKRLLAKSDSSIVVIRDGGSTYDSRACLASDSALQPVAQKGTISVWRVLPVAAQNRARVGAPSPAPLANPLATQPASTAKQSSGDAPPMPTPTAATATPLPDGMDDPTLDIPLIGVLPTAAPDLQLPTLP